MSNNVNRKITIFINGKAASGTLKQLSKEARILENRIKKELIPGTQEYYNAINELAKLKAPINQHRADIRKLSKEWEKSTKETDDYGGGVTSLGGKIGGASGLFTAGALAAGLFTTELVQGATALFQAGVEMEVLSKKAEKVFGEALPMVTEEAERNANSIGMTISQYTDAAAAIGDLLVPMGFQRTEAANISSQLVNLSGALSEWSGGTKSAIEVNEILSKALLGEREGLKQLGISIQEADVKSRLAEKGLGKLTGTMLQQAKAAATLELILEKSTDAQAAYESNTDTLVRKQAVMNAKFLEIKDTLTAALIPVFNKLLTALLPVADGIKQTVDVFASGKEPTGQYADVIRGLSNIIFVLYGVVKDQIGVWQVLYSELFVPLFNFLQKSFGPVFSILSKLLGTNTTKTREFTNGFGAMTAATKLFLIPLKLVIQGLEFLDTMLKESIIKFFEFNNAIINGVSSLAEWAGYEMDLPTFDVEKGRAYFESLGNQAGESFNKGMSEVQAAPSASSAPNFSGSTGLAINNEKGRDDQGDEDRLKKLEEQEQRANEIRLKKAQELNDELDKLKDEQFLKALSDQQRDLELESRKYDELIQKAIEYYGESSDQVAELEFMKEQRLTEIQNQYAAEREQAYAEKEELDLERKTETLAKIGELTRTALEEELFQLEQIYETLIQEAERYGVDTSQLVTQYESEKAKVREEFANKEKKEQEKQAADEAKMYENLYSSIGSAFSNLTTLLKDQGGKSAEFAKLIALAEVGFNTAKAISGAVAQAQSVPFPGNIAAIATGVAAVLANIATAKNILSSTPVPQKKDGGFFEAIGADDNRSYNARYLGRPGPGFLPPGPQLILANENGREYFVPNNLLTHPVVADNVRIIEAVRTGQQFVDGGFTTSPVNESSNTDTVTSTGTSPALIAALEANTQASIQLMERINAGIYVVFSEDDARDVDTLISRTREKDGL